MSIPDCIVTNLQCVSRYSHAFPPSLLSFPRSERSLQEKRSPNDTLHFRWILHCRISGAFSIDRSRFSRKMESAARIFRKLKNQPRVKCIQDAPAIFNGKILQHDLRQIREKFTCVFGCVYVWVCACLKFVALAGPMGAGDVKNPGTKEWRNPSNCFYSLDLSLHVDAFPCIFHIFKEIFSFNT